MTDDDKPQIDKFKEAARDLECDDDVQRFKERVKRVARPRLPESGSPDLTNGS